MLLERYEFDSKTYLKWKSTKDGYIMFSDEKIAWIDANFARVIRELREEIKRQEDQGETVSEWAKSYIKSESTPEMEAEAQRKRDLFFKIIFNTSSTS